MENEQETVNEFGEFGEIAVKNCFICGKTIRQRNCYGFTRSKDISNNTQISSITFTTNQPKSHICLKCLLKGLYSICPDKKQMDEYFDLYIKIGITEELNKPKNLNT